MDGTTSPPSRDIALPFLGGVLLAKYESLLRRPRIPRTGKCEETLLSHTPPSLARATGR